MFNFIIYLYIYGFNTLPLLEYYLEVEHSITSENMMALYFSIND